MQQFKAIPLQSLQHGFFIDCLSICKPVETTLNYLSNADRKQFLRAYFRYEKPMLTAVSYQINLN